MTHWHKYFTLLIVLCMGFAGSALAQDQNLIRYVRTTGAYSYDGKSWGAAKKNVQDAINDLRDYMQTYGITEGGRIYVAAGTYTPTESTEELGGGVLYTAFKLYAGISVYGGFSQEAPEATPEERAMIEGATHPWEFKHETILSGNHKPEKPVEFTWNTTTNIYTTSFPTSSYHVVWFATNGFTNDRANALPSEAVLDGVTIEGGDAKEREMSQRKHTSYGGGAYMVEGAVLRNCVVRKNEATLRGGGVYMDGGGTVDSCHIHTNQAIGVGILQGYGGGVCADDKGVVKHSIIQNNVARMGGGLALTEENATTDNEYRNTAAAGCVVANNTSSAEAGGVLLLQGGLLNHMTIVRNKCAGPDVILDGRRLGRSGGLYLTKSGFVTNSVIWGNACAANSDMQFAAYTASTETLQPTVSYTAVGNGDVTDWNGVKKQNVMSLANEANTGDDKKFPDFLNADGTTSGIDALPAGVNIGDDADETKALLAATLKRWRPAGTSPLREAGVQIKNYDSYDKLNITYIEDDMLGGHFMQLTTLGAYIPQNVQYMPVMLASEEGDGNMLTFFVDPEARNTDRTLSNNIGSSWKVPMAFVNDVAHWMENHFDKEISYLEGGVVKTQIFTHDMPVQVYVKQGELHPIGFSKNANMRSSYVNLLNHLRLYGSVPRENTETQTEGRNVMTATTTITANITNNGYAYNACHIMAYAGASNTVVDGFRMVYANSLPNTELNNQVGKDSPLYFMPMNQNGAAIVVDSEISGKRSVKNNFVRNCILANNTAVQGAALYVRSENDNSEVEITFENCIFHNNTSVSTDGSFAAVHVESTADGSPVNITFDHCDFLKNVGYGLYVKGAKAQVTLNNSVVWANAAEALDNSALLAGDAAKVRTIKVEGGAQLRGTNNKLDASDDSYDGLTNTASILTYTSADNANYTYPISVNPTKNVGHSVAGDLTYYGGAVDFTPRNMSPLVNAAASESGNGIDMKGNTRNYGGLPDVGALENTMLPANGKVLYVRDYRTADGDIDLDPKRGGDGLSWATAINGNAVYEIDGTKENAATYNVQTPNGAGRYEANAIYKGQYSPTTVNDGSTNLNNKCDDGTLADFSTKNYQYTGGLQYAVNKARMMYLESNTQVQVWVAGGVYTEGKGFKMQDGVDVFGGFPRIGNPGMTERNPRNEDYQTVIQVRDVGQNPLEKTNGEYNYISIWNDVVSAYYRASYDWYRVLTQPRNVDGTCDECGFTVKSRIWNFHGHFLKLCNFMLFVLKKIQRCGEVSDSTTSNASLSTDL